MTAPGFRRCGCAAALAGLLLALPPTPTFPQNASPAPQEMEVLGVATDQQSGQPMVLLRGKTDRRALTMVIDPSAAVGIAGVVLFGLLVGIAWRATSAVWFLVFPLLVLGVLASAGIAVLWILRHF